MNDTTIDEFHTRIQRLEREARRQKIRLLAVIIMFGLALALLGRRTVGARATIAAREIVLLDEGGTQVIELAASADGPALTLRAPDGTAVILTAGVEGAGLMIEDPQGPDVSLLAGDQPYLFFGDAGDLEAVLLGLDKFAGPRLQLRDARAIWSTRTRQRDGDAALVLRDGGGEVVWKAP